jgi:hypothetical protein
MPILFDLVCIRHMYYGIATVEVHGWMSANYREILVYFPTFYDGIIMNLMESQNEVSGWNESMDDLELGSHISLI